MKLNKIFKLCGLAFLVAGCSGTPTTETKQLASDTPNCRCTPEQDCWPTDQEWQGLASAMQGPLIQPVLPLEACEQDDTSKACLDALKNIKNPFFMQSASGRNESQGWYNAWKMQPSSYAAEVESTNDVVQAVNFARDHNLRLVVKGAGHDYLGRSSGSDALLIWTHNMRDITFHEQFHPQNCPVSTHYSAVTVSAGNRWIEAYDMVTNQHGQYVQGGGCTTVGAAGGFPQGGGFGSWSKEFGTGAGGIVEAEVVTADGQVVIANECQNQDLFWAIKGGGGGTFGVVTHLTLRTHALPGHFGLFTGEIKADSDGDYQALIKHFLAFYYSHLNNANWGEQFSFRPSNLMTIAMVSQGLSTDEALAVWQPFVQWVSTQKGLSFEHKYIDIPASKVWSYDYWAENHPDMVIKNTGPNAREGEYWWASNSGEVFSYWYTYQSWYLPLDLFDAKNLANTANIFYQASRLAPVSIQINKGLAGGSQQALELTQQTSMHPGVYDAGALAIMSYSTDKPQMGEETMSPEVQQKVDNIYKAMGMIKSLAPNAGTYANEADYFEPNWQEAFWGSNYPKLLEIKNKYDPNGLFYCHHCVGSESWTANGMCKAQ